MNAAQLTNLLSSMNTEEKLAQLTQLNPVCFGFPCFTPLTGPDSGLRIPEKYNASIGSVLNCDNAKDMLYIQKEHLKQDPHKIPLLFMADIIHGFKTIFPIPLALGCSFSPEHVEETCRIAALESAASGIHVTFSPMADLVRDPRWGRVMESFGEDPHLNASLCASSVRGYQGDDISMPDRIAACVKHFAAYGAPEGGREYNTVDLSYGILQDTYLPAYRAAIDAGAKLVMSSFNIVDRVPATGNKHLLQNILRMNWQFKGPVISDFNSVGELINHGVARDEKEAAALSFAAGVDIEMMSPHYCNHLAKLLETDSGLTEDMLDTAVMRILELKNELGLFEHPCKDADCTREAQVHLSAGNRSIARHIAADCAVLLKNENVLPLPNPTQYCPGTAKPIGLTGPFAASPYVLGGWSAGSTEGISLYEGLCNQYPASGICYKDCGALGSWLEGTPDIPLPTQDFIDAFNDCDTVIVAAGENQNDTGEGGSKAFLRLSPHQESLIQQLKANKKQVVVILFSARPLEIAPILSDCDALLQAWFLGTESGNALTDLLIGAVNPSGRLSMSFPYTVGQIPVYYNHFQTGRPCTQQGGSNRYLSRYLDCPVQPLFCFGYGLSYSEFSYTDFYIRREDSLSASVTVTNCSHSAGTETVQLYIQDIHAPIVRPVKELKGFQRIFLEAGASQTVSFPITRELLSYHRTDTLLFEPGAFNIQIGKNSEETLSETIMIDESTFAKEQL